uniref:Unannotated protein n=1 Tax=freshwater metagenome TaxID=449393 RepID=A0A6J7M938_9ZZZZ
MRHRGLRRLGAETVDDPLQAGDLLRLSGGHLGKALLVLGTGGVVLAVRAAVLHDLTERVLSGAVQVDDAGDCLVEEVEVVGDDEQRAPVRPQEAHQPVLRVHVEVVRWLVEQQHVGTGEQDPGELHPAALAAGQVLHREVQTVCLQAETRRDRTRLAVGRVPALGGELLLGLGEAPYVAVVRVLLHCDPKLLDAHEVIVDTASRQDVGDGGAAVHRACGARVLRQVTEAALLHDVSGGWLQLAAERAEQARLAGTVAADQGHFVPGHDRERRALEHDSTTHLHRKTRYL